VSLVESSTIHRFVENSTVYREDQRQHGTRTRAAELPGGDREGPAGVDAVVHQQDRLAVELREGIRE
jgi:hypothetical protein